MQVATLLLASAGLFLQDPYSLPGPFHWGEQEVLVPSGSGDVGAKLYYPSLAQGAGTPISPAGDPFPVIAFAHGFVVSPEFYDSTLRHLATRGYIVIATRSQQLTFETDRAEYVADFRDSISYVIDQNSVSGSFLENRVATDRIGVSGHSLGGGISILASAEDARIVAAASLAASALRDSGPVAPPPPPPYADEKVVNVTIPLNLINGSLDAITPVATNGQIIYDAANAPKLLPNIEGGYHVGFTDIPFTPPIGDIGQPGSLTLEENLAAARAELTIFFDLYLKGDQSVWRRNWGPERLTAAGVETQLDPGFELLADPPNTTGAANEVIHSILVTNNGVLPDQYTLFAEDNIWDVTFEVEETPLLNPGESFRFDAIVTLPVTPSALTDVALISARSERDGGTRAFTTITTAIPETSSLVLLLSSLGLTGWTLRRRAVQAQ